MKATLTECFFIKSPKRAIKDSIIDFVKLKKGRVLIETDEYVKAKFGNKIITRLFGAVLLNFFKQTLPFYLEARIIQEQPEKLKVEIILIDSFDWIIRDSFGKSAYNEFFFEILNELKRTLSFEK